MKILIESPFDLNDEEKKTIEAQVSKLGNYNYKITQASVFFKMDDGTEPDAFLAEVRLHVPGNEIFASESDRSYMRAFSDAASKAKQQLLKRKDIQNDHHQ